METSCEVCKKPMTLEDRVEGLEVRIANLETDRAGFVTTIQADCQKFVANVIERFNSDFMTAIRQFQKTTEEAELSLNEEEREAVARIRQVVTGHIDVVAGNLAKAAADQVSSALVDSIVEKARVAPVPKVQPPAYVGPAQ